MRPSLPRLFPSASRLLHGPPFALPPAVDHLAERWASLAPRQRVVVGILAVMSVVALTGLGAARSPWGPDTAVLTAARDLPAGHRVDEGDLTATTWPARLVPDDAVKPDDRLVDDRLAIGTAAGAVVTERHVARHGLAAELVPGQVALAVPRPDAVMLEPGQKVDVIAGSAAGGDARVAATATILAVEDTTAWITVPRQDAVGVARAAFDGQLTMALLPP